MDAEPMTFFTSIAAGLGLAAACGFRVFIPLLVTSIAANSGQLTLSSGFEWIGSYPAMASFGVATALEIASYYIPWVDNLLDSVATPAAVVAGAVVSASVFSDMDPFLKWSLAIVAGGGAAGTVQGATVLVRGASSVATGGLGNPGVSTAEAGGSIATAGLAVVLPFVALGLVVLLVASFIGLIIRRRRRKKEAAAATTPPPPEVSSRDEP